MNTENIKLLTLVEKYWPCFLILLAFIGFISKSLYNYPVGLMAIIGLYQLIRSPDKVIHDPVLKLFSIIFLCLWLPMLISFIDAVNHAHTAHTVFPYLRFYFAGVFIITALSKDADRLSFIIASLFYIVLFWCIDATIQFVFDKNLVGFPYESGHITGMFYPRNTISHICSILAAFTFLYIFINLEKNRFLTLGILPLFFIIFLSGRRAAWVMLALNSFGFLYYGYISSLNKKSFIKLLATISVLITTLITATILLHGPSNDRFKATLGLFSSDYNSINRATAYRLPIWETSLSIFKSNPVNGIGPRGFRHAYRDYAEAGDMFVEMNDIPTQPHILIMEILAETGLIGFIAYLFVFYSLFLLLLKSKQKHLLIPFLIPVVVAMFPLNTHMAFYGSIWSSMVWLLIALYFAKAKLISNKT